MDLLKVSNLNVKIEDKKILQNINFTLKYGEIILISGNSGCGKSTLINAITGVIPEVKDGIVEGKVIVEGRNIIDETIFKRANDMVTLIQDVDSQIINIMVDDELSFILENSGEPTEKIDYEIKKIEPFVNIQDIHTLVNNLSGGQKQRVALASLLVKEPKILILDEPLANLDEESIVQLLKHIKELRRKGISIIIVEHRLEYLIEIVDKLMWMHDGKIEVEICDSETKEIFMKNRCANNGDDLFFIKSLKDDNKNIIDSNKNIIVKEDRDRSLISIKNLNVSFNKNNILKDISLKIDENIIIVGSNGAGKTTLIKTIASITKYKNINYDEFILGDLKINNRNNYKKIKKEIGYVFQNPSHQLFMQSVEAEIFINAKNEKIKDEIIKLFNLEEKLSLHPLALSQGEKRLLAVASTLAKLPKIIFLDEPTIGLDYKTLTKLLNILKYISEFYKVRLVIVTHDKKVIKDLGYRVLQM